MGWKLHPTPPRGGLRKILHPINGGVEHLKIESQICSTLKVRVGTRLIVPWISVDMLPCSGLRFKPGPNVSSIVLV